MKKKVVLQPKLKLSKEKIVALTQSQELRINGGVEQPKSKKYSLVDDCGSYQLPTWL